MGSLRTLWGIGTPRTLRPQWALHELGLEYNHKKFLPRSKEMDHPDFLALNPRHKVPFYQDDRVRMGESAAIVLYLADRHGGDVLTMPAPGTEERAILQDRTLFIMSEIDARMYTVRLHSDPPEGLSATYGSAPTAVDAAKKYADRQLHEAAGWFRGRPAVCRGGTLRDDRYPARLVPRLGAELQDGPAAAARGLSRPCRVAARLQDSHDQ
jgi:glutathione S-transferase